MKYEKIQNNYYDNYRRSNLDWMEDHNCSVIASTLPFAEGTSVFAGRDVRDHQFSWYELEITHLDNRYLYSYHWI